MNDICDVCDEEISGSHYHCGYCNDTKTTSMLGHYTVICRKRPSPKGVANIMKQPQHRCCPDGYCGLGEDDS